MRTGRDPVPETPEEEAARELRVRKLHDLCDDDYRKGYGKPADQAGRP